MLSTLREDIDCVFERDPAARNVWEVLTCYPGLKALWAHRLSHWLWKHGLRWLARTNSQIARFLTGIEIHPGAVIGRRFFIDHGMGVVIGETAEIGDNVTLYHQVTLGGTSWNSGKRHPTLEDNVVVGAGAKVLGPITIGAGVRVGSNSVVVRDVPAAATVVGIPARVVAKAREPSERVAAMAKRMGFDAYGLSRDMPDPVADALNAMLDHMHTLDERVIALCDAMARRGEAVPQADIEPIEKPDFCREEEEREAEQKSGDTESGGRGAV
jgi:serine O-acetyltransferase